MRKLLLLTPFVILVGALVVSFQSRGTAAPALGPQRSSGSMTTTALPGVVKAGGTVQLSLTVAGPAQYDTCRPVRFWVTDAGDQHRVWTEVQFWMCPATTAPGFIPAGKSQTFATDWHTGALAPGVYHVHGSFGSTAIANGDIPLVGVEITR